MAESGAAAAEAAGAGAGAGAWAGAGVGAARIGPNAVLQLLPVIEARAGRGAAEGLLAAAGLAGPPGGDAMIPERDAARLHQALRARRPREAADWGAEAGRRTADYILAHRIPPRAQALLRAAPARLAAPLLARAIARHAWTFAGSGRFEAQGAWRLVVHDNPMVRGERAAAPLCRWHAAVFERLYRALAADDCRCRELRCGAQPGETACVFEIRRGGDG